MSSAPFSMSRRILVGAISSFVGIATVESSRAGELIFANGTHESVKDARKDSKGQWYAEREGHRTPLRAGDVVVVIDDAGKETVTIPELVEGAPSQEAEAALAKLRDPKNVTWQEELESFPMPPFKATHDALLVLSKDSKQEMRRRAVHGLSHLRTKASVMAASEAILAEKDSGLRRELASVLFSVEEIFSRCENGEAIKAGLADKESAVRYAYAMLAPDDLEAARTVLRGSDGIGNSDHHFRESAAEELGERGDGAGATILIGMLARNKIPGLDCDEALATKLLVAEHVRLCKVLGKLGTPAAKTALEKAKKSPHAAVRDAATAALSKS